MKNFFQVPFTQVRIKDKFWLFRIEINRKVTIPVGYNRCKDTGRIDAWKLKWKEGYPDKPHIFWDSDIAKWMEAASNTIALHPDEILEKKLDEIIDLIKKAQQKDGYLNTYFTVVAPTKRWTNLRDKHELYCAGHLIEAAIAHYNATGKKSFIDIICKYTNYIYFVFGYGKGGKKEKKRGYPGHEEIELALIKLYRITKEKKYLELSKYFIDERGKQPHYFDIESIERGEKSVKNYKYWQAHLPVRKQSTAVGHSVRAMYLYCAMTDLAVETNNKNLADTCRKLWRDVIDKKMYITGGIGSTEEGESFSCDYYLPNETAYAETCAAIGLVFWADRMLQIELDGEYADVMERALYNSVLSGISLSGDRFFYANPLCVIPKKENCLTEKSSNIKAVRQEWFDCSCCPTNIVRILSSLGQYIYSTNNDGISVNLFVKSSVEVKIHGQNIKIEQDTRYPWEEKIVISVDPEKSMEFTLFIRIPGWCLSPSITVNEKKLEISNYIKNGYIKLQRIWRKGDKIQLIFPMDIMEIEANPLVYNNCNRIAIQRGPLIYCLEEVDNCVNLHDITIKNDADYKTYYDNSISNGVVVITGNAERRYTNDWKGQLYRLRESKLKSIKIKAVPYCMWNNRDEGEMIVWIGKERRS